MTFRIPYENRILKHWLKLESAVIDKSNNTWSLDMALVLEKSKSVQSSSHLMLACPVLCEAECACQKIIVRAYYC